MSNILDTILFNISLLKGGMMTQQERMLKGSAWAWLKSEMYRRLGSEGSVAVLSQYYKLLRDENDERARLAAGREIIELRGKLAAAELLGQVTEVRKFERMIARREARIAGN